MRALILWRNEQYDFNFIMAKLISNRNYILRVLVYLKLILNNLAFVSLNKTYNYLVVLVFLIMGILRMSLFYYFLLISNKILRADHFLIFLLFFRSYIKKFYNNFLQVFNRIVIIMRFTKEQKIFFFIPYLYKFV